MVGEVVVTCAIELSEVVDVVGAAVRVVSSVLTMVVVGASVDDVASGTVV